MFILRPAQGKPKIHPYLWKICHTIDVSFLLIGYTDGDKPQATTSTSDRLYSNDAIMLSDLHTLLSQKSGGQAMAVHMRAIVSWSGHFANQPVLCSVLRSSLYRYFLFHLHSVDKCKNEWTSLRFIWRLNFVQATGGLCFINERRSPKMGSFVQFWDYTRLMLQTWSGPQGG